MKSKVYITRRIPEKPLTLLERKCDLFLNEQDRNLTKDELCENLKDMDGCICTLSDLIDREVIGCMQKVKVIANYAVGYNNIDFEYAASKGIIITNTPGVLTNATTDLAWGLLISVARRIVEADKCTREGKFRGWSPTLLLGQEITGKTLGVIGAGRIGANFAKKAKSFDMRILYFSRTQKKDFENETGAVFVDKNTLLRESDFISVHVPLTSETRHIIGLNEFKMMKKMLFLLTHHAVLLLMKRL
jgi:glyoxylate reductase